MSISAQFHWLIKHPTRLKHLTPNNYTLGYQLDISSYIVSYWSWIWKRYIEEIRKRLKKEDVTNVEVFCKQEIWIYILLRNNFLFVLIKIYPTVNFIGAWFCFRLFVSIDITSNNQGLNSYLTRRIIKYFSSAFRCISYTCMWMLKEHKIEIGDKWDRYELRTADKRVVLTGVGVGIWTEAF